MYCLHIHISDINMFFINQRNTYQRFSTILSLPNPNDNIQVLGTPTSMQKYFFIILFINGHYLNWIVLEKSYILFVYVYYCFWWNPGWKSLYKWAIYFKKKNKLSYNNDHSKRIALYYSFYTRKIVFFTRRIQTMHN